MADTPLHRVMVGSDISRCRRRPVITGHSASRDQLRVEGHALARLEGIHHRQLGRAQLEARLARRTQVLALPGWA